MLLPSTSSSFLIHFAWQLAHIDSQDAARRQSRLSMTSSRILFKSFRVYAGSAIYSFRGRPYTRTLPQIYQTHSYPLPQRTHRAHSGLFIIRLDSLDTLRFRSTGVFIIPTFRSGLFIIPTLPQWTLRERARGGGRSAESRRNTSGGVACGTSISGVSSSSLSQIGRAHV